MPDASSGSVRVFFLDAGPVRSELRAAAVRLLAECPEVRQIVLFGSLARGNYAPGSDADVALILDRSPEPSWVQRIARYLPAFSHGSVGVDVFPYTQEEIDRALAEGNPFFDEIFQGETLARREQA